MSLGIAGIVNRLTRSAIIEWIDPAKEPIIDTHSRIVNYAVEYLYGFVSGNSITPDVKKQESHRFQSEVTQNTMEDGSIVAEHIIQKPIAVTLSFEMTNGSFGSSIVGSRTVQQVARWLGYNTTFDKLVSLWEKKIECTVITQHRKYENMVIENLPIVHKSPYKNAYQVMCDFIQLKKKDLGYSYPAKEISTAKSAMKTVEGGLQKTIGV